MNIRGIRGCHKPGVGYTILEVMIFIAVSAFIFITAMTAIGGRQQEVQFAQSARELESRISDTINDITTGYFPENGRIKCTTGDDNDNLTVSGLAADQATDLGSSQDCLYIGKALQFEPSGTDGESRIYIYNIVGKRYSDKEREETTKTLDEAEPEAVALLSDVLPDPIEQFDLRYGLSVKKIFEIDSSGVEERFGLIGILSNFEGGGVTSSISSSQSVQVGGIKSNSNNKFNRSQMQAVNIINQLTQDPANDNKNGYFNTNNSGTVICLANKDDKKASITVGGNGDSRVVLQIDDLHEECRS